MAQPQPVTAGMFAEMVELVRAELTTADPGQRGKLLARPVRRATPAAFSGHAWVSRHAITLDEVAEVTGLAYNSLRRYRAQARQARAEGTETFRHMPDQVPASGWQWGALVLWRAVVHPGHVQGAAKGFRGRWPDHATYLPKLRVLLKEHGGQMPTADVAAALGIGRRLATELLHEADALPRRVSDDEALTFLAALAAREGRRLTLPEVIAEVDAAGMTMWDKRIRRLYLKAGGRVPAEGPGNGPDPAPGESLRADGLVSQAQVARWFDVSPAVVYRAVAEGRLTPALEEDGHVYFDWPKVARRADFRAGPVDIDHPLAEKLTTTLATRKEHQHAQLPRRHHLGSDGRRRDQHRSGHPASH